VTSHYPLGVRDAVAAVLAAGRLLCFDVRVHKLVQARETFGADLLAVVEHDRSRILDALQAARAAFLVGARFHLYGARVTFQVVLHDFPHVALDIQRAQRRWRVAVRVRDELEERQQQLHPLVVHGLGRPVHAQLLGKLQESVVGRVHELGVLLVVHVRVGHRDDHRVERAAVLHEIRHVTVQAQRAHAAVQDHREPIAPYRQLGVDVRDVHVREFDA